jgi:hypothetical protein
MTQRYQRGDENQKDQHNTGVCQRERMKLMEPVMILPHPEH